MANRSLLAAMSLALALGACAREPDRSAVIDAAAQQLVTEKIADSAGRVARATETLALIQRARTEPSPPSVDERLLPGDLRRPITLNWSGPGEEGARRVANLLGYEFRVVGNPPAVSPPVQVGAEAVPAAKVLEDIGLQVQGSAQVVVDPNVRRVEYRYIAQNPLLGPPIRGAAPPLRRITK
ncbi:hypothetical protein AX289_23000 [Methylorubrum populi]|nr:hypothetical protein AX289_23000 [Methylorubrum populi]